jgi:hypothetical protein
MIKVIELGGPLTSDGLPKMAAAAKWVILCISVGSLGCFPGSPERGTGTTEPGSRGLSERNPNDWDAYLRRAEANQALNQREAAALDYTKAIALHPSEAFLYLRRGRHLQRAQALRCGVARFRQRYSDDIDVIPSRLRPHRRTLQSAVRRLSVR